MKLPFIGLMGVASDGALFAPNGGRLFRVPPRLAWRVQRIQHWVASKTWK